MVKSDPEKILYQLQKTIILRNKRMQKRANGPSAEMLTSIAQVTNAYTKLYNAKHGNVKKWDFEQDGDPFYHDRLEKEILKERGMIK